MGIMLIFLLVGLLLGVFIGFLFVQLRCRTRESKLKSQLKDQLSEMDKAKALLQSQLDQLQLQNDELQEEVKEERKLKEQSNDRISRAEEAFKFQKEKLEQQKKEMEELQEKFTLEFENIASKILKANTVEFVEVNQKNISEVLSPLKEKISTFEKKVEDTYQKGIKDQTDLKAELKKLYDLNNRISQEANNLTNALKSDSKKQGNWGEIILERVLERSGLVKGQEYETQVTARDEDGNMLRPDVVVHLPDKKHVIVDAKVSLIAYEAFVNEEDENLKHTYLKQHIDSIKSHVKGLADKSYQHTNLFDTPDFVLLFLPMESAFSVAVQSEVDLFNFAWEKKIVIVSPTTLLATLRTIASLWKHEKQTQNAMEIARQGGALYDKFVGFMEDMKKLGDRLRMAQQSYDAATNKLSEGKGNLMKGVDKLKELGAKTKKSIDINSLNE